MLIHITVTLPWWHLIALTSAAQYVLAKSEPVGHTDLQERSATQTVACCYVICFQDATARYSDTAE